MPAVFFTPSVRKFANTLTSVIHYRDISTKEVKRYD